MSIRTYARIAVLRKQPQILIIKFRWQISLNARDAVGQVLVDPLTMTADSDPLQNYPHGYKRGRSTSMMDPRTSNQRLP